MSSGSDFGVKFPRILVSNSQGFWSTNSQGFWNTNPNDFLDSFLSRFWAHTLKNQQLYPQFDHVNIFLVQIDGISRHNFGLQIPMDFVVQIPRILEYKFPRILEQRTDHILVHLARLPCRSAPLTHTTLGTPRARFTFYKPTPRATEYQRQ